MRAGVMGASGSIGVTYVNDPSAGPGELILRVTACGLCGSDLKIRSVVAPGAILGHEFGGEVVGVGPATEGWRLGMRAAVLPVASCRACASCRNGDVAHCVAAVFVGLGGRQGGFAELISVPASSTFLVPDSIDPKSTALVEPFAVGLHIVNTAGLEPGDKVLVVGAGTVGLTCTTWAQLRGAERVTIVDPSESRRELAGVLGATDGLASVAEVEAGIYDVAIECVGKTGLLDACIGATRAKGRVAVAGVCTEPDPFTPIAALMKELTIRFAVYYTPREFETVIAAIRSGAILPGLLVGQTLNLDALGDAFDLLASGSVAGKILVVPG